MCERANERQQMSIAIAVKGGKCDSLDVHHGVGVLASVGLRATAGAGCNGHPMLPAAHVAPDGDIQRWVSIEEAEGLEEEAHMLCWHDWPVLHPWDVRHSKGMP